MPPTPTTRASSHTSPADHCHPSTGDGHRLDWSATCRSEPATTGSRPPGRPWRVVRIAAVILVAITAIIIAMRVGDRGPESALEVNGRPISEHGGGGSDLSAPITHPQVDDAGGWTPEFIAAWEAATQSAAADGVALRSTSGYRSTAEQQALWDQAVAEHGSAEAARRWVLPPGESAHVGGTAADVDGPSADWILNHGWQHGLCVPYESEWWHVELLTTPGQACPPRIASPAG